MKNTYKLIWSDEALNGLKEIIAYLEKRFSEKDVRSFVKKFDKQLELTKVNMFANDTAQYFSNTPNLYFGINFFIYDEYKTSDGNRNCNQKDLAIKYMNQWDENSISFKCNKTSF